MSLDAKLRWKVHVTKKTRRAWTEIQENILAHGKKIGPVDTQYADAVQTNIEACVDLRHKAVGMHESEQHWHHSTISKQGLRNIVNAPWYIRNTDLQSDLQMEIVTNEFWKFAKKHEERLLYHVNVEVIQLLDNSELVRRLKRKKPLELV